MGQVFPAAARTEHVEDGVDDLTDIYNTRAAELVGGNEWFEDLPLSIGQVAWV